MKKFLPFGIFILLFPCTLYGQAWKSFFHSDSISHERSARHDRFAPYLGMGLIAGGILLTNDHSDRPLPSGYRSAFSCKADEVLRFAPALALVGMKTFGIESRTPWGRMLVSDALSLGIMGVAVESTKRLTKRVRPDGSNDRSFPSGHTAAAFVTATMFAKEYGWRSPWYSVGAYTTATTTALLRRVNDKHWMSDLLVGAGIGILSTELGYYITDLIYKDSPRGTGWGSEPVYDKNHRPSYLMPYLSMSFPSAISGRTGDSRIRSLHRWNVGLEGGYFLTPHWGMNGRIGISSGQIERNGLSEERPLDFVSLSAGPSFSCSIAERFLVGCNLRGGYGFYPNCPLSEIDYALGGCSGWTAGGGVSLTYLNKHGVHLRLFTDYEHWPSASEDFALEADVWSVGFGVGLGK